jgi:hypothetical protein
LEKSNRAMATQLQNMRARLAKLLPQGATVGTALMLLGACFTVFTPQMGDLDGSGVGRFGAEPSNAFCGDDGVCPSTGTPSAFRARTLLSMDDEDENEKARAGRNSAAGHHARPIAAEKTMMDNGEGPSTETRGAITDNARWREFRAISSTLASMTTGSPAAVVPGSGGSGDNSTEDDGHADASAMVPHTRLIAPVAVRTVSASAHGAAVGAGQIAA